MGKTADLNQLISSLSGSEKRYFKIFSSQQVKGKENEYILLFNIIEKLKTDDDEKIKKALGKSPIAKRLPVVKNYLYTQLLKSLRNYHSTKTLSMEMRGYLDDIETLYNKGLLSQCLKVIKKAKQFAHKYEFLQELSRVVEMEIRVTLGIGDATEVEHLLNEMNQVAKDTAEAIDVETVYLKLYRIHKKVYKARHKSEIELAKELINNPVFEALDKLRTFRAKRAYYQAMGQYYLILDQEHKANQLQIDLVNFIMEHPDHIELAPHNLIMSLLNICIHHVGTGDFEAAKESAEKVREVYKKYKKEFNPKLKSQFYASLRTNELIIGIETGQFEDAVEAADELAEEFEVIKEYIDSGMTITLNYLTAFAYFGMGSFNKALHYLNNVLNMSSESRLDFQDNARIFNLILHYELGNTDVLTSYIRSVNHHYSKKDKEHKTENLIMKTIRKLSKLSAADKTIEILQEAKAQLEQYEKNPLEKRAMEYFHYVEWMESKITGKPFAQIVKDRLLDRRKYKTTI